MAPFVKVQTKDASSVFQVFKSHCIFSCLQRTVEAY